VTFHLLRPFWLLAAFPAAWLWWAFRHRQDRVLPWRQVIAPELLAHLIAPGEAGAWWHPIDWLLGAWLLGILAVAGPSWDRAPSPFAEDAPPVMIVLKVTPSMAGHDLPPSRLARAQEKISDLLRLQPGQAAGLIAYAGSAQLVLPPTHDSAIVVSMAQALSPDEMPKAGDDLAGAISLARRVLAGGGNGGSILVMADDVAPRPLSALRALPGPAVPVTLLAMVPRDRPIGAALRQAASILQARLVAVTTDPADVAAIGRRLAVAGRVVTNPDEPQQWRDRGWYLTPLLALLVLLWFRRGWMVAG
jgi:Ca-activated chloride channel homolog